MIKIILSDREYEYDIRALTKAFYPKSDIMVICYNDNNCAELLDDKCNKSSHVDSDINDNITFENKIIECQIKVDTTINHMTISLEDNISAKDTFNKHEEININIKDDIDFKAGYKNILKKELYHLFTRATSKKMPWGTLTGIRPTKLAMDRLEEGCSDRQAERFMKEHYLCSEKKAVLATDIAKRELEILQDIDYKNGYSLYIGIPFCPTTCLYCSFTSYSAKTYEDYIEHYLEALYKEMEYASRMINKKVITTVYIGGGTPTTLNERQLEELIYNVKRLWDFKTVREFTVEAGRPDSITKDKLIILKKYGVTRISINPQSMRQKTLDLIGRKHTIDDVITAFNMARECGHDNINMDIILGLLGEDKSDVQYTLDEISKLNPDSLTVHTLAIKRAAYLNIYKERYENMLPKHVADMVEMTMQYAKANKYAPYYLYRQKNMTDNLENIGYSRKGKEGIYNILIMEEKQTILALGAGAVCKFIDYDNKKLVRVDNVKSIKDYIERIEDMIEKKQKFIQGKGAYFNEIF